MSSGNLAEQQILKAQAEGKLNDLEGAGKPLPNRPSEDAIGVGMRIMAQAGFVPREFELKKAVDAQLLVLQGTTDPLQRKQEMKKLADLQLRHAIEREARRKFFS
ncbi:protein of unknown function [Aliiroseovarius crassostreae]|uniref:Molecular chaperone DnaJ n=1 Tax=Aliiroseovarius crassostreae TaxID=154981 RepID=A0A0P7IW17_9RHOB|nr:DnaJ family domain-containing protein [Aliiroseovarius crassostreae]KPN63526.1 molecular chaperone DnaJ [Aliiroseovarius crassostreae]SFU95691.1 protein of unknown function [Aliiroseovarius crassostreae]